MLSRVANSLFWSARYAERTEAAARMLLSLSNGYQELQGLAPESAQLIWPATGKFLGGKSDGSPQEILQALIFDTSHPGSLLSSLVLSRENARSIRDQISAEVWETVNVLFLTVREASESPPPYEGCVELLMLILDRCTWLHGFREAYMMREDGWHFLRLGRHLERAEWTLLGLEHFFYHPSLEAAGKLGQSIDPVMLTAALRSFHALDSFSRSCPHLLPERVAEFLVLNQKVPRSVVSCLEEATHSLHELSRTKETVFSNESEQIAGRLLGQLRFLSVEELFEDDLQRQLSQIGSQTRALHQAILNDYFA